MATNAENTQAHGNAGTQQSSGKTNPGAAQRSSSTSSQSVTERGRADQERAIRTSRDADRSMTRPPTAPIRGIPASPFWLMRRIAEDMDHMLEDFGFTGTSLGSLADRPTRGSLLDRSGWSPQVETFRRGDKIVVRADLPGLKKEDVKVELDDDVLTISGERSEQHEEDRDNYYRSERSYGQFYRAIPLPDGVNGDQVDATFKDGVLEVTLGVPKEELRRGKQIEIR